MIKANPSKDGDAKLQGLPRVTPLRQPVADVEAKRKYGVFRFFLIRSLRIVPDAIREETGMKRIIYLAIAMIFSMNLATIPAYAQEDNHNLVSQLVVLPQDHYNEAEADKMMDRLSVIPANLLEGLKARGVKIKLANGEITDEPEFANYKGVTPRGWENTGLTWDDVPGVSMDIVIVRIGYSNKGKGHNGQNLELHETFHAVDRLVLNNVSSSQEFVDLWKKEANNNYAGDGYVSAYAEEYFAETATLYFYSDTTRERLKQDMPLTFDFLDKLFANAG